jgi:hypothetical protein
VILRYDTVDKKTILPSISILKTLVPCLLVVLVHLLGVNVNKQCPDCTCPIWDVNTVTAHMTHTLAVWLKRMPSPVSNVSTGETGHAERTARRPKQQGRWPASSERQPTAGRHAILPDGTLSTCPLPKRSYIGGGRLPQLEGQMEGRAFASWCGVLLDSALLHLFLLLLEFLLPPVVDTVSRFAVLACSMLPHAHAFLASC